MLLVTTKLAVSDIEGAGFGLFATEHIPAQQVVWKFESAFDQIITVERLRELPPTAQESVEHFGYISKRLGGLVICGDIGGFMNHSDEPNVVEVGDDLDTAIAARDIYCGDELLCNYYEFDIAAAAKLR